MTTDLYREGGADTGADRRQSEVAAASATAARGKEAIHAAIARLREGLASFTGDERQRALAEARKLADVGLSNLRSRP